MITASPEWQGWNDERQNEYFKQAVDWLEQRHGKHNVVATVSIGMKPHRI